MSAIRIEKIKPSIGSIVHVDRDHLLDAGIAETVRSALDACDVLVFPRLGLTDEEQLSFTDSLGARVNFTSRVPGGDGRTQDVYQVTLNREINNEPEYVLGTFFWHMDGMPVADIPPPKATLLSARHLAPKGGQTEFASTRAAYESLSSEEKSEIEGLQVMHSARSGVRRVINREEDLEKLRVRSSEGERPLVLTAKSGLTSLLIGETADRIVGMPLAEGRALLARLLERAAQIEFTYRHYWQEGDLVIWNNCAALHRVVPYASDSGRMMHRTSLAGEQAAA